MNGAHGRIRTSDRLVRSQVLYPAELHARNSFYVCSSGATLHTRVTLSIFSWRDGMPL